MSGYFKKQKCCALGWQLWQKCSFHRKMSEPITANPLAAARNFIQWQQISNRRNKKNKINPKHVIAYQTVTLFGKYFQWKYGFVQEMFRCWACFSAQFSVHVLEHYIIVLNTTQILQKCNVSSWWVVYSKAGKSLS